MNIEPQDYLQKLVQVYQSQCNQFLQERIALQAQLDLVLAEIEKLNTKIKELDPEIDGELNVNPNPDS